MLDGGDVEKVVGGACLVRELEGGVPGPAEVPELEVGDGDGALCGSPGGAAGVWSGEVEGVGELRDAEGVGLVGG